MRQLAARDKQLADLTDAVKSQAQSINADRHNTLAGTLQPMLEASDPEPSEEQKKPGLLARRGAALVLFIVIFVQASYIVIIDIAFLANFGS